MLQRSQMRVVLVRWARLQWARLYFSSCERLRTKLHYSNVTMTGRVMSVKFNRAATICMLFRAISRQLCSFKLTLFIVVGQNSWALWSKIFTAINTAWQQESLIYHCLIELPVIAMRKQLHVKDHDSSMVDGLNLQWFSKKLKRITVSEWLRSHAEVTASWLSGWFHNEEFKQVTVQDSLLVTLSIIDVTPLSFKFDYCFIFMGYVSFDAMLVVNHVTDLLFTQGSFIFSL